MSKCKLCGYEYRPSLGLLLGLCRPCDDHLDNEYKRELIKRMEYRSALKTEERLFVEEEAYLENVRREVVNTVIMSSTVPPLCLSCDWHFAQTGNCGATGKATKGSAVDSCPDFEHTF